ncbi:MAG: glycosyltransferase [Candidatus Eisenbacteria sp.]|nr:glycosyltransferase [Candidatus Eisenbacteria bacterium]
MRVLMVSYTSLLQRAYRKKCDELGRLPGVDLTVLAPPCWREWWSPGRGVEYEVGEKDESYRSVVLPIWFSGNGHVALFRRGISCLLREVRPDIIDLEREPWCWAAAQMLWSRNRQCPGARLVFHTSQSIRKWYPPPFRQIEKATYRGASAAMARSESAARVLRTRGFEGKIDVVPHGVDTEIFRPADGEPGAGGRVVGFVGALTGEKGVPVLLEALARMGEPARGLIVGDGPERERLEALAQDLKISSRVEFTGSVRHHRIPEALREMSVFVLPSVSSRGWVERFGRVLLEAMASGIPVVGSDSGEIPNVVGDGGIIVPEGDPDALASALRDILGNRERARDLGYRARRRVEKHYSWKHLAGRTLRIYREILEG